MCEGPDEETQSCSDHGLAAEALGRGWLAGRFQTSHLPTTLRTPVADEVGQKEQVVQGFGAAAE